MDNTEINAVEWFYGYGGNSIGLKRIFPNLRIVAGCEIEAYAVANAMSKMEEGRMDSFPIWTDCKTFPTKLFKDRKLDLFIASYPCQGFSVAGKRLGKEDDRYLWPYVRDFVAEVQPEWCFFENVEGHITLGLSTVISDLAELGYDSTWGLFSASEVGAPHQRKRVFILANSRSGSSKTGTKRTGREKGANFGRRSERTELADSISKRLEGHTWNDARSIQKIREIPGQNRPIGTKRLLLWPSRPGESQYEWEEPRVVDSEGTERRRSICENDEGRRIKKIGRPDRTNGQVRQTKPQLGRTIDGTRNRVDRLRLLGNGVVPSTAEKAFITLYERFIKPIESEQLSF